MTHYPDIRLRPLDDLNFEVVEDCFVDEFGLIITKGSINDLASVPRWLWWLIPPHGDAKRASVVHDFLMRASAPFGSAQGPPNGNQQKAYADAVFYCLLKKDVPHWQAVVMFLAVVWFRRSPDPPAPDGGAS
jgi:hypothetical protein